MEHAFNVNIASKYSVNVALFLHHVKFWTFYNLANNKNIHDGLCWTYNSLRAFQLIFPYWSKQTLETTISKCIKAGLIKKGNYNKTKYDRTSWYALTYEAYQYYDELLNNEFKDLLFASGNKEFHFLKSRNQLPENKQPIPDTKTNTKTNTTSESCDSESPRQSTPLRESDDSPAAAGISAYAEINRAEKQANLSCSSKAAKTSRLAVEKQKGLMLELINVYREVFPNNPQPHKTLISTSLQKTLQTLIKRWPDADPAGHAISSEAFRRYLVALKASAPNFSLNEYETRDGNKKKNGMETFCRWNTFVKFLERQYS